ncbi:MAG: isoleucine--tRNA ligase [Planctomycetota bacterium]
MAKQKKTNTYKDTLNLPQTTFDMRAGLLKKEPARLDAWAAADPYARVREARDGAPRYILHDGPPYANGDIHMGHLLNKVLKDVVVRYKTMTGHDAPYIPGWDCHGLPIEAKVMEELHAQAGDMDRMDVRRRCRAYAEKFIGVQAEQFRRLGVWGDYAHPYITMDPAYEADVIEVFARMVGEGVVYRQLKPVHWSIENRTALADAELEYQQREDASIYVRFDVADPARLRAERLGLDADGPLSLMIWTTTPWTLPANLAVAVHPDMVYAAVRYTDGSGNEQCVLVAEELIESVFGIGGDVQGHWTAVATVRGTALAAADVRYVHPIFGTDKRCPVVTANYVTLEEGTGLVHTAPGHGVEDYGTGLKYDLDIYCPVRADGTFDETVPAYLRGQSVWEANELVCRRLDADGALFHLHRFTHSYPHDWRSKQPTIFRATEQWFIAVDRPLASTGKTLREMALDVARPGSPTQFVPEWGRKRMAGMLESRPDWCISRQRSWGLPIPSFVTPSGEVLLTAASVRAVADHFRTRGSDSWFTDAPADLLATWDAEADPEVSDAAAFDLSTLTPQMDIFDVWFESGSSWYAVAVARGLVEAPPVDLYLEGSDQHRGWFQLSMLPALAAAGTCPFTTVLTHGFVVDEHGYKMSKSLGNAVNVQEELAKRGADIMRLWVSSVNYQDDIRTSDELIGQIEDAYRKIRNTLRFAMGNCFDFDPTADRTEPDPQSVDRWMRGELDRLTADAPAAYEAFEFHRVYRLIYEFCTVQASSIYMAAVKDRLYCDAPDSPRRRATQTILYDMALDLTRLLAPIMPFTAAEAWENIPNRPADLPDSVHLALMPKPSEVTETDGSWQKLLAIRDEGLVRLEALRAAGVKNPLDAEAVVRVRDEKEAAWLEPYVGELEDLLGVGYARVEVGAVADGKAADVDVADTRETYDRCARSWKRRPDVGSDPDYPDLSARDAAVVKG